MKGELLGIPSVSIMTEAFINGAELMASTLGADDHGFVVIDHPIASASGDELAVQAERAARSCVALLTVDSSPGR